MTQYALPDLPYDYSALEPHYPAKILELHHDKHHAAYVAGANATLEKLAEARSKGDFGTINQLQKNLAFHVSGHMLHAIFWTNMSPDGGGGPEGELSAAISDAFGSLDAFKAQFNAAAAAIQGSGWATLSWEPLGQRLVVEQIHDHQDNSTIASTPLLLVDMWEHAFYLEYQNRKADWLKAFWNVANWADVAARFETARSHVVKP